MNRIPSLSSRVRLINYTLILLVTLLLVACGGTTESVDLSDSDLAAPINEEILADTSADAPAHVDAESRSGDQVAGVAVRPIESAEVAPKVELVEADPISEVVESEEPAAALADDPIEVAEADAPPADSSPPPDDPTPTPQSVNTDDDSVVADKETEVANDSTNTNDTIVRTGSVAVDFNVLAAADPSQNGPQVNASVPSAVTVNLFDDVTLTVNFDYAEPSINGSVAWIGSVEGIDYSDAVFAFSSDRQSLNANINVPNIGHFRIRGNTINGYTVEEYDPELLPRETEPEEALDFVDNDSLPAISQDDSQPVQTAGYYDGTRIIDVMVVYTPAASVAMGGAAAIETGIIGEVASANASYNNSLVDQLLRLVNMEEVAYTEAVSWSTMLYHLTFDIDTNFGGWKPDHEGKMDNVHTLRTDYAADLVVMIVDEPGSCGIGWLNGPADYGFSVVDYRCFGYHSFAHEMGHNMGAAHNREQACGGISAEPCDTGQKYPWSFGYLYYGGPAANENFRTIMSYNNCPTYCYRINYWSHPDIVDTGFTDQAMGVPRYELGAADNHLTLDDAKYLVASFSSYDCASQVEVTENECLSLLKIFEFNGDLHFTNWGLGGSSICTDWVGVTCSGGNVTELDLSGFELNRPIDSPFSGLTNLIVLDLSENNLIGNFQNLGTLTSLETLNLSNNSFSGEVPVNFENLTALTTLDIGYNAVTATGTTATFLDTKDPDWASTQTVTPTGLSGVAGSTTSIDLSWTAIPYTGDGGSYEVSYATNPAGPFTVAGNTADKTVTSYSVTGLRPDKIYTFRLRTITPAHGLQLNALSSDYTATVSVSTDPIIVEPSAITSISTELLGTGPYQMVVTVEGTFALRCGGRVDISDTLNGTDIEITFVKTINPNRACSASAMNFTYSFILSDTYSGMTYNILINGVNVGSVNVP